MSTTLVRRTRPVRKTRSATAAGMASTHETNTTGMTISLPLPNGKYRWSAERGCWLVHYSVIVPSEDNPRENLGNNPPSLKKLVDSIRSKDHGGIHEPLAVYIEDYLCHTNNGHRRYFAIVLIITMLKEANPDADTSLYEWIPVTIQQKQSRLDAAIHRQSSDSLHEHWTLHGRLQNAGIIFEEYQKLHPGSRITEDDVPEDLAQAAGLGDRLKPYIAIHNSPMLMEAVFSYQSCTYKTWYNVLKIQKVLKMKRTILMEEMTGLSANDSDFGEAIYRLLVAKVAYYVDRGRRKKAQKAQPGAILERCLPLLNRMDFPASRIRNWLKKKIDLTPNGVERYTEKPDRDEATTGFLKVIQEAPPNASEKRLQEMIERERSRSAMEFDEPPQAAIEPMSDTADKSVEIEKDVKVKGHKRARPQSAGLDEQTFVIRLPSRKQGAFAFVAPQIVDLLQRPKLCDKFEEAEKTIALLICDMLEKTAAKSGKSK